MLKVNATAVIAHCQTLTNYIPKIVTPDAGSLGEYGQVPVSLYNGLPDITIPIYTIKTRSLQVPISLKYYAGGNRVDDHPGWVGLGWSLHAGGVITRITNGLNDEADNNQLYNLTGDSFSAPYFGYYFRSNDLTSTWNTSFIADSLISNNADFYEMDTSPDEFLVSCDGFSASLYFYRTSSNTVAIKIQSQDGQVVKAEAFTTSANNQFEVVDTSGNTFLKTRITTSFIKFIITTLNGTQYIFGGDSNSIDLSTSLFTSNNLALGNPTAWYLTKIISPVNDTITFNYAKKNFPIVEQRCRFSYDLSDNTGNIIQQASSDLSSEYSYSFLYPAHLTDIEWNNGGKITFIASRANELISITNMQKFTQQVINLYDGHANQDSSLYMPLNYYLKLDQININNQLLFNFQYNNNPSQRLRLLSLTCANTNNLKQYSYLFGYNPNLLPAYNSDETDNWGYYNGKYYGVTPFSSLYAFRTPNATLMQAEMLDTITYPTGGKAILQYEPNDFSKIVNYQQDLPLNTPFNLKDSTSIAGGLRIKQITFQFKDVSTPPIIKQYIYKNADLTSSGILSNIPIYSTSGNAAGTVTSRYSWFGSITITYNETFISDSENPVNWLDRTNGNSVTYRRVIEKLQDNSQTIYTYTNYDDFPDLTPLNMYSSFNQTTFVNRFISKKLERGLLLKTEYYDKQGRLVKKIENQYNNDPLRYNDYVKSIYEYGFNALMRYSAIPIYTFYPYLKTQTATEYDLTTGDSIQQKTFYTYGANNLISAIKTINSHGDTLQTSMNYSGNYQVAPYTGMYQKFMVNYPIEITHFLKNKVIGGNLTTYKQVINSLDTMYLPDKTYSVETTIPFTSFTPFNGTTMDSHYGTPNLTFLSYDAKGNIREVEDRAGISTTYLWGYEYQYPIAAIKNAIFSQVKSALGMSNVDTQLSALTIPDTAKVNALQKQLTKAMVSTYTYQPLIGMTSEINPQNVTTNYIYDVFGRLFLTRNDDKNLLVKYRYGYYDAPDNGMGGYTYTALSTSGIKTNYPSYVVNTSGIANVSATGGSGSFTYTWTLWSSGSSVTTTQVTTVPTIQFTCSQIGEQLIQCKVTDNQSGNAVTTTIAVPVASSAYFWETGFACNYNSIAISGSTVNMYFDFYSTAAAMQTGTAYLVANIMSQYCPSTTRNVTYTVNGNTWYVSIYSNGNMYITIQSGSSLPVNSGVTLNISYAL
jgi:hypothetical protein